jgi:hypothetical protein
VVEGLPVISTGLEQYHLVLVVADLPLGRVELGVGAVGRYGVQVPVDDALLLVGLALHLRVEGAPRHLEGDGRQVFQDSE